jgi:hypothetical protein
MLHVGSQHRVDACLIPAEAIQKIGVEAIVIVFASA